MISEKTPFGLKRWIELRPPHEVKAVCEAAMAVHDARKPFERWGGNQWGEQWVCEPWSRPLYQRDMPLLMTDLPFAAWRRACGLA